MKQLSSSKLSVFKECPRCFWLAENKKIVRPRGIFPSLPGGMDGVIKRWWDRYREMGKLPPELDGKVDGILFPNQAQLKKWRYWKNDLAFKIDDVDMVVAFDDLIVFADLYTPLDAKTRGYAPKPDAPDYYGSQLDIYSLALSMNKLAHSGKAVICYFWPKEIVLEDGFKDISVYFDSEVQILDSIPDRAVELIRAAKQCLAGDIPPSDSKCEMCAYVAARRE